LPSDELQRKLLLLARRLAGKMSILEINIAVFPTFLYSQQRDLIVWKYLQLNNSTCSSIFGTTCMLDNISRFRRLGGQEEKDIPSEDWFSLVDAGKERSFRPTLTW